jgi:hypothetical protein
VNVPRGRRKTVCTIAILHENLEHLARLAFEQAVVREHDGGTAAGFQDSQDVLQEVQLLFEVSIVKSSRSGA